MSLNTEDKLAIQELTNVYANSMDDEDIKTWLNTWTDDGVWEGRPGRYEGKEKLAQLLPDLGERVRGKRHAMSNFVIEGDGSEARQTSYLMIFDRQKTAPLGTGVYEDQLRKINGVWKFVYRKVTLDP